MKYKLIIVRGKKVTIAFILLFYFTLFYFILWNTKGEIFKNHYIIIFHIRIDRCDFLVPKIT